MPKRYVRPKDRRVGLAVKDRKQSKVANGNQWVVTPRQHKFIEYWLTPSSPTFSNAYQSAIKAGFSKDHATQITTKALDLVWVREARRRLNRFTPEHTIQKLQDHALHAKKDADSIRSLELLGKIQGIFIDRSIQQIDVQFNNDVPRPISSVRVDKPDIKDGTTPVK